MKSFAENKIFSTNQTLNIRGRLLHLDKPKIMGILNVTPDSFYDGGRYDSEKAILSQAEDMIKQGATFIDVGGYSTRPGASDVPVDEETRRVTTAIRSIVREFPETIISIDTFRSSVANAAIYEGAGMINDVSGGSLDEEMFRTAATHGVPYILMHMRGTPATMNTLTDYTSLLKDVTDYFHQKIKHLQDLGVKDIVVDPGFGFAKRADQSFALLNQLNYLKILGKPLMAGISRKSMIWRTLGATAEEALNGTTCLNTIALMKGASLLRVHDVREANEVCKLFMSVTSP
jgi:dihydropteroate synthase